MTEENSSAASTQSSSELMESSGEESSINSESSSIEAHSRDAVWTDFKWDCVKAERSVTFRILPNCDIENMIVQVSFRDSNLDTLETKVIIIGDVIGGNEVVFVHTLADNAFTEGKIIYGCHLSLRSGTVYL